MEVELPCTQETLASSTRVLSGLPSGVAQVVCICASISQQHIENELFSLCISYLLLTSPTLCERNYMLPIAMILWISTVIQSVPTLHVCTTALISQAMLATCISHELMKICDFAKRILCLG